MQFNWCLVNVSTFGKKGPQWSLLSSVWSRFSPKKPLFAQAKTKTKPDQPWNFKALQACIVVLGNVWKRSPEEGNQNGDHHLYCLPLNKPHRICRDGGVSTYLTCIGMGFQVTSVSPFRSIILIQQLPDVLVPLSEVLTWEYFSLGVPPWDNPLNWSLGHLQEWKVRGIPHECSGLPQRLLHNHKKHSLLPC